MKLLYPAYFHQENNGFWVEFPDVDGCFSQGDTLEDVFLNATQALTGHCVTLIENQEKLPIASDISSLEKPVDGFVSLISSDIIRKDISIKKTLTIPAWLNDKAIENQVNFSKVLKDALMNTLEL